MCIFCERQCDPSDCCSVISLEVVSMDTAKWQRFRLLHLWKVHLQRKQNNYTVDEFYENPTTLALKVNLEIKIYRGHLKLPGNPA